MAASIARSTCHIFTVYFFSFVQATVHVCPSLYLFARYACMHGLVVRDFLCGKLFVQLTQEQGKSQPIMIGVRVLCGLPDQIFFPDTS